MLQQPRCKDGPCLPRLWQMVGESRYCKVEIGSSGSCQMTSSASLDRYGNWTVFVGDKEVPQTCPVLDGFSPSLPRSEGLSALLTCIDDAVLCPGNPEDKFIVICQARAGAIS